MPNEPNDQQAVIDLLSRGRAYGRPDEKVERFETHAALVFLIDGLAYKMKRAARYSFLDFSTLEKRHDVIEAELRLNRRTAPQLYRRVLPVTRSDDGDLRLDGPGQPVEWLLEMGRFDQSALLDNVAAQHGLNHALIEQLAEEIVAFHRGAEVRPDHGGGAAMEAVIVGNAGDLRSLAGEVLPAGEIESLNERTFAEFGRRRALLEERRRAKRVRHCHGDLHLGNIVLIEDRPVLFDCLEFDEALACTDTLYDLAFLLMDLCHRGLQPEAQRLLGHYLELESDDAGVALLPLFLSCRAAIRAKTQGFAARLAAEGARGHAVKTARSYLELALRLLRPPPPRLIAIGGLSGTGKSSLALALAPEVGAAPGAVVLRSDRLRKRLLGVRPSERLPPEGYSEDVTARVYAQIAERAEALLRAGHGVIADAVYADPRERADIEASAERAGAPFCGLWLEAPQEELERRITRRRGDPSDATVEIMRRQMALDLGRIDWRRIEAVGAPDAVAAQTRRTIDI